MKIFISKLKATAIVICVLLMASAFLMSTQIQPVQAQLTNVQEGGSMPLPSGVTPDETYPTLARLAFRPQPIGLGQPLLVNVWVEPPINIVHYFKGYTVTFTKPDGTTYTVTRDSYRGDSTAWFEYTVDQTGTWTIKFDFPGGYFPRGNYTTVRIENHVDVSTTTSIPLSVYYQPSSSPLCTFVVQQDIVYSWPAIPLPTDYWTRPISPENRDWMAIAGDYPWPFRNIYNYNGPNTIAPKSAHVVWRRMDDISGLPGGIMGQASINSGGVNPTIIYAGRGYDTYPKPGTGVAAKTYWRCYDIRTGEVFWERPLEAGESAPNQICYDQGGYQYVPGEAATQRNLAVTLMTIGTRLIKYDPYSGAVLANWTTMSGTLFGTDVYSVQDLGASKGAARYRLIKWSTIDSTLPTNYQNNFTARIDYMADGTSLYNISWPYSTLGIVDFNTGVAVHNFGTTPQGAQVTYQQRFEGTNILTGANTFNVSTDLSKGVEGLFSGSTMIADQGKFAVRLNDGNWHCWDLLTGKQAWVSELSSYPWGVFGIYGVVSAYGLLYSPQYDGVAAYDWTTGKLAWHFTYVPEYPWEVVYNGTYPFYTTSNRIADGIIFCANSEHSPSQPITRGLKLFALNATTGENIWNITGGMLAGAIADGYLAASDPYDGYEYVFGKGKSATTVTAPDVVISNGSSIVIKGTVLDQSPAQPGTPCVSKDSMATQMEYLHMQHPIDGVDHKAVMTGVPVLLTALDSNDNAIVIGTVTTSAYYGTFEIAWTPPAEGMYRIIASFAGDDSYGSSSASTAISVGPAQSTPETPTYPVPPDYTMTIIGGVIAVIIAVAIAAVAIILIGRKR